MKSWPEVIIMGGLLLAGCASVDPVVVAMHGGDPTDAGEAESPYAPPPDVLAEGLMPRQGPPQPESMQQHEHGGGHAPAPDGVELPAADREIAFSCPMHPNVLSREAGTCPECGMTLEPVDAAESQ